MVKRVAVAMVSHSFRSGEKVWLGLVCGVWKVELDRAITLLFCSHVSNQLPKLIF